MPRAGPQNADVVSDHGGRVSADLRPRQGCLKLPNAATAKPSVACSSPIEPSYTPTATGCLGPSYDAEDVFQETLLRAWRALPRFGGQKRLRPWLFKIATNACFDAMKQRPKRLLPRDDGPPLSP